MKLEVGMYVRTKDGYILKLEEYIEWCNTMCFDFQVGDADKYLQDTIKKASNNIIDLIELGDYVNGYVIDYISDDRKFIRSNRPYRDDDHFYKTLIEKGKHYNNTLNFKNEDIKEILTKEQYEANCYKVGDNNVKD